MTTKNSMNVEQFTDGIISSNGNEHTKIIRFDFKGFHCTPKNEWEFYDLKTNSEEYLEYGCFAFLRFIDTYALSGVKSNHDHLNITYIPNDWEVYARNGISDEDSKLFVPEIAHLTFVKVPITMVLDRIYANEVPYSHFEDVEKYKAHPDGINFNRLAPFLSCEIILTEEQVNYINAKCKIAILPKNEMFKPMSTDISMILNTLYEQILLPIVMKHKLGLLFTEFRSKFIFRDEFDQEIVFKLKPNKIIVIEELTYEEKSYYFTSFKDVIRELIENENISDIRIDASYVKFIKPSNDVFSDEDDEYEIVNLGVNVGRNWSDGDVEKGKLISSNPLE